MKVSCSCSGDIHNTATLFESGHYYQSHGPTLWSQVGWNIVSQLRQPGDHTTIMVDDVHPSSNLNAKETNMPVIEFNPDPCFTVMESTMVEPGMEILKMLVNLPVGRRHRPALRGNPKGYWACSGFPLTSKLNGKGEREPLCLLYDMGLTLYKYRLGFRRMINVLPEFYSSEQYGLIKLVHKVVPDLELSAVLYDMDGGWRCLRWSNKFPEETPC